ncbi:MAG: glycosyltransferase family 2 protein [Candidatus Auribacterota bacterium]|nr:glycosyltransferase family 2 protein [Candidatus Auribacterota bacterium]
MNDLSKSMLNQHRINYSVVVPVFNAGETLLILVQRIKAVFHSLGQSFDLIFVDDKSSDNSWQILQQLKEEDSEIIKIIKLGRNFGQHNAIMCGFHFCRGEYVITLDDDLQNPPEEIPKLIEKMKDGYDVVYGIYGKKAHSPIKNFGSRLIGWYYRRVFKMNNRISAFRLISNEIVGRIINYDKSFTYIDGLISWNTSSIGEATVEHSARTHGRSGYNISKILKLSFNMLTNFSAFPIRIVSFLGVIFSTYGFGLGIYFFIKTFVTNIPVTGYASLMVAITIFSGVQLLTIGVIGEYIARVHMNINRKPQYVIKEKFL